MTQKQQTDYDKALQRHLCGLRSRFETLTDEENAIAEQSFRKGYEHGRNQRSEDVNLVLIADGEPYATARERAIEEGHMKWNFSNYSTIDAYRQAWNDSDAFDEEWTAQHPKDLLERLLADHPDIIENEVKARMSDIRKEAKENENAFAFASDNISQNAAIHDISSDKLLMRAELAKAAMQSIIQSEVCMRGVHGIGESEDIEAEAIIAAMAVSQADALIAELEKTEEQWAYSQKSR